MLTGKRKKKRNIKVKIAIILFLILIGFIIEAVTRPPLQRFDFHRYDRKVSNKKYVDYIPWDKGPIPDEEIVLRSPG